ncbi:40S ribosomal protein S3a, partial [Galemys pyrenaicus]
MAKTSTLLKAAKRKLRRKWLIHMLRNIGIDVKAPAMLSIRNIGKTLVMTTQGTKIAFDGLRVLFFEVSHAHMCRMTKELKMLKKPKCELGKLMELHSEG